MVKREKSPNKKGVRRAIAEHADRILADARKREQENAERGMTTVTIPRAQLILSLRGKTVHSPFLTGIGLSNAVRGANFLIEFDLMQPDPFVSYSESNLGLCYCWSDAGGLGDAGQTLLLAEPTVGVVQVDIGQLNSAPMPYTLTSTHLIPTTFRLGPADLNYFLYQPNPFGLAVLLTRGNVRVVVT